MSDILRLENVRKTYPSFTLKDVSFEVKPGQIMGFIGRNGAGKTTTLKCIMNLIHYESGKISAFETDMSKNELENKQRIGFALSELNYYPNKTIRQLMNVTKRFYKKFDEKKFNEACRLFNLNIDKKLEELSSGMKVKYSVAIALSHHAELLILDEPTSGLDPVSRDEILDIFRQIVKNKDRAILFSTHITSDLDKCASDITYIHDGEIIYSGTKNDFVNSYLFIKDKTFNKELLNEYIAYKEFDDRIEGLISPDKKDLFIKNKIEPQEPDLEQIMVYIERSKKEDESFDL
ncbi:MAG: ABC transporter ATP-binding protein [Bacilli bacterium]|jgi:ABC-2 type transport system ATP-binding protein|nr:ABC transporter ATP-binding protein [Bacilli bacterium]MDD3389168.1 ABC transporter ATP-binding protein [Bacilli bacterium]